MFLTIGLNWNFYLTTSGHWSSATCKFRYLFIVTSFFYFLIKWLVKSFYLYWNRVLPYQQYSDYSKFFLGSVKKARDRAQPCWECSLNDGVSIIVFPCVDWSNYFKADVFFSIDVFLTNTCILSPQLSEMT